VSRVRGPDRAPTPLFAGEFFYHHSRPAGLGKILSSFLLNCFKHPWYAKGDMFFTLSVKLIVGFANNSYFIQEVSL
jgi:hypothetical protein